MIIIIAVNVLLFAILLFRLNEIETRIEAIKYDTDDTNKWFRRLDLDGRYGKMNIMKAIRDYFNGTK